MTISFKGAHFPQEIILMGVRWYLAYPLSTRHVEELMEERGVELDHATINRWVTKYSPLLQYLRQLYEAGGGLRDMNTAQASNVVENLRQ